MKKQVFRLRRKSAMWMFAILPVLLCADIVAACDCAKSSRPCDAFWKADAVFSGTVTSRAVVSMEADDDSKRKEQKVAVKILVEEVFRGGLGGNDVEMITGLGDGDCGYRFEKGRKYLVYAYEQRQRLYTSICHRTKLLSEAKDDLAYFRNLPPENSGGSILVKVLKLTPAFNENTNSEITPMQGVGIIAEAGDQSYKGKTNQSGQYEFKNLPPGKYKVTSDIPKTSHNNWQTEVTVDDRACASVEFWNKVEGRIQGTVFDEHGNPAAGVKVDLIELSDAFNESPGGRWRYTIRGGTYDLQTIPPGKYVLGVNLIGAPSTRCPRARTFYDNRNSVVSGYVEVKAGEELHDHDIRLLPGGTVRPVEGVVVWPNGKPAVRATIMLANGWEPHFGVDEQRGVDAQGRFVLRGIEGCRYTVYAFTYGGRISANSNEVEEMRHAEPVTFTLSDQSMPLLRLVLTSPGFIHQDDEKKPPSK